MGLEIFAFIFILLRPVVKLFYAAPGNGMTAGLLYPFLPTALTPNITLSLLNGSMAVSMFPTSTTCVQNGVSVALQTISYPTTSPLAFTHLIILSLLSDAEFI